MRYIAFFLLLAVCLTGCRSAEDAFNDAQRAEMSGNDRLAIRYYIETIRLNPEMHQAKQRLAVVGQREVDRSFSSAENSIKQGRGHDGLNQLNSLQQLHRQISTYTPQVKLPGNFTHLKDKAQSLARSDLFRQAKDAERRGEWDKALGILTEIEAYNPSSNDRLQILNSRVLINDKAFKQQLNSAESLYKSGKYDESLTVLSAASKYADNLEEENLLKDRTSKYKTNIIISEATALKDSLKKRKYLQAEKRLMGLDRLQGHFGKSQLDAVRVLKIKLYNSWAADLTDQGKFRESWHTAAKSLEFEANNRAALDIQRNAMQLGRVNFVLLPLIANKNAEPFIKKVDADFNNGPARNLPPFTLLVSDFDLRDAFRAFRVNPQNITREQAVAVARRTNAKYIIFRELTSYRLEEQFISSSNMPVRRKDNTQSTMEVRKGELRLNSRMLITIVDSKTGHRVFSKEQDISSKLEFEQGFLIDPIKNLALTDQQRSLLEPPADSDFQAVEGSSVKAATDFFLKKIFPEMEKLIP